MHVLYLHPAGAYGGAAKSLIELFQILKRFNVTGTVLTPYGGSAKAFEEAGMSTIEVAGLSQFDNTQYGHYRRLRWLILLRELTYLPGSLVAIWRLRGQHFDLLHVNEVTLLPIAIVAKKLLKAPMVVHVRSLQCKAKSNWRSKLVNRWLKVYADIVIPIDHTVARTLDPNLTLYVVHNGLSVPNFCVQKKLQPSEGQPIRVGFMGVLIALKGVYELVDAIRILKERGVEIECVIAGENAREIKGIRAWVLEKMGFGSDVRAELKKRIKHYGLEHHVTLLGFVKDVNAIYPRFDILCFPSHLNAAGRPVFEAAFFEVPSVVAIEDPLPDAVMHGQTGLAIPRADPELIADALQSLALDHQLRLALGRRARTWAVEQFSIEGNAAAVLRIYCKIQQLKEST